MREKFGARVRTNFIGVIDTTLREGEQFAGVFDEQIERFKPWEFNSVQATIILRALHEMGVKYAELPNPMAKGMQEYLGQLISIPKPERPKLLTHIRAKMSDFQSVRRLGGVDGVNILAVADPSRIENMQDEVSGESHTMASYMDQVRRVIRASHDAGLETRLGIEHSWDVDIALMMPFYRMADDLGVARVSVADTRGSALHFEVAERISRVKNGLRRTKIQVHFHDDTGGAYVNALTALAEGASYVDTTLLGIGERTGIVDLSKFVVALAAIDPNLISNFNFSSLTELERQVAQYLGIEVPHNLPASRNAFAHKAGIHHHQIRKVNEQGKNGAMSYQATDPVIIGNQPEFVTVSRISGSTGK
jgi:homocitrate synthase